MNATYFISASLPVAVTDDRLFVRRLHALVDLSVGVLHVAALRSGSSDYNQTTNGTRPEGHMRSVLGARWRPAFNYASAAWVRAEVYAVRRMSGVADRSASSF
jgi:hypothetical protein